MFNSVKIFVIKIGFLIMSYISSFNQIKEESRALIDKIYCKSERSGKALRRLPKSNLQGEILALEKARIDLLLMNFKLKAEVEMLTQKVQVVNTEMEINGYPMSLFADQVSEEKAQAAPLQLEIRVVIRQWNAVYGPYQEAYLTMIEEAYADLQNLIGECPINLFKNAKKMLASLQCNPFLNDQQRERVKALLKAVQADIANIENIEIEKKRMTGGIESETFLTLSALTGQTQSNFLSLPNEVFEEIFPRLDATGLTVLSSVSKELNHIADDDSFWRRLFKKDFADEILQEGISSKSQYIAIKAYHNALLKVWPCIEKQIIPRLVNPPRTSAEIKTFLNDSANAGFFKNITELDLKNLGLKILPSEISKFTDLQLLHLSHNQIAQLPDLSALTQLRVLDYSYNQLTQLPAVSALAQLKLLDLSYNQLTQLPDLSGLAQLRVLDLSHNQFTQLSDVSGLSQLKTLDLSDNQLAQLPDLRALDKLTHLDLTSNQLFQLPDLRQLPPVRSLLLDSNPIMFLEKGIPDSFPEGCAPFIQQLLSQHVYPPQSVWGQFYQDIITQNYPEERIQAAFKILKTEDRHLIYEMVWMLSGKPKGDPQWGEHLVFDNMLIFYRAVHKAILTKLERLPQEKKNAVFGEVYKLAGCPDEGDAQWGEHHALDNIPRLADALSLVFI